MSATNLTGEQITALRDRARRSGHLIDPRALHKVDRASFHDEWATSILGRAFPGVRYLDGWEIDLLAAALDAEPDRPVPAAVQRLRDEYLQEQRAERDRRAREIAAQRATWHALRDRLPVPVTVGHNATLIHTGSYAVGRDHIVVQAELRVGRLYRPCRHALCETPAMGHRTTRRGNRDPLRGLDRDNDGQDRIPTCKACLRHANRIAQEA